MFFHFQNRKVGLDWFVCLLLLLFWPGSSSEDLILALVWGTLVGKLQLAYVVNLRTSAQCLLGVRLASQNSQSFLQILIFYDPMTYLVPIFPQTSSTKMSSGVPIILPYWTRQEDTKKLKRLLLSLAGKIGYMDKIEETGWCVLGGNDNPGTESLGRPLQTGLEKGWQGRRRWTCGKKWQGLSRWDKWRHQKHGSRNIQCLSSKNEQAIPTGENCIII